MIHGKFSINKNLIQKTGNIGERILLFPILARISCYLLLVCRG
ncbi:unnamed protein product [Phyllotreta striolata]|uniref:Uncharacterized protein n=1 Tax=Phyllotreta striolata TaxID=444603 RepID=A0A9N9XI68_PHYSR|nr:unnamed protein product [Phyllotreta striolata]